MTNTERDNANNKEIKPIIINWQETLNNLNDLYQRESRTGTIIGIGLGKEGVLLMKYISPKTGTIRALMYVRYDLTNIIHFNEGDNIMYYPTNVELFAGGYDLDKGIIEINERILPKRRFTLDGIERSLEMRNEEVDTKYWGSIAEGIVRIERTIVIKNKLNKPKTEIFNIKDENPDSRIILINETMKITRRLRDFIDKWG